VAATVNLDALIPREDFLVEANGVEAPEKTSMQISELESDAFFFGAIRKPDFQRETAEWEPRRVMGLIRTFVNGELIPAVILWKNRELLFVIDGSHRLSALIAWVQNDYGDGDRSQEFFNHSIPEEQIKVAQRTREMVETEFGSYKDHKAAIADPSKYGPDLVARARRFGSLGLALQWVRGDATTAEASFVRINQQAAMITPQELELIRSRKKPQAIAARAIKSKGTGHKYWASFGPKEQTEIQELAAELHALLFEPVLRYPIKSLDMPAGGSVYSGPSLRMIFDFITLCVDTPSPDDDTTGHKTIEYLKRCRRVMRLILSNHSSSLGLLPAVYFYSWTGNQQPILFLTMVELLIDFDRAKQLNQFTDRRAEFERFLYSNRTLTAQVIRKFGTKDSGEKHLKEFYRTALDCIGNGTEGASIVDCLRALPGFGYLQPDESPYEGVAPTRMSTPVRAGLTIKKLLETGPRCAICGGFVPTQALSLDHINRTADGGLTTSENTQLAHPYCNTGYKEGRHALKLAE
jgi:hypothetical protein